MLNTKNDLFQIVDGVQSITIRRSETNELVTIKNALPRISRRVSYVTSNAQSIPSYSATWNIPQSAMPERPKDGDVIIAGNGVVWVIYKVAISAIHQTWRCLSRSEIPDFKLDEYVNIIRAFAEPSSEGGPMGSVWKTWKTMIPVKFAYDQILIETEKEGMPSERTFRVYFKEKPGLQKTDLIERPDGTRYKIRRIRFSRHTYGWTEVFVTASDSL